MDPTFLPAWRLAEMTRAGEIGCLELLDHFISRVERLDGRINAVVVRDLDRARLRARRLDAAGRVGAGPLFGVPMTVKESFDLDGLPSTWGFAERREQRAEVDALAVQRLERDGAVVFGKTNVPVGLADWQSYNPIYGATSNPWNVAHTPGGSSGGGAAACAAGFGGLELGSDIGGSIRVPAHFCGLFGHKPSWGLCPSRGHSPGPSAAPPDIAVIGPLARSARDLAQALDAIAGPDPLDAGYALALPPPRVTEPHGLRVAVWAREPGQATDPETSALIEAVGRHLADSGAEVSFEARPAFNATEAFHLYLTLLDAALSARIPPAFLEQKRQGKAALRPDDMSATAVMLRAVDLSHSEWLRANDRRAHIRRAWGAFFQCWDVLLCPVFATPALPHMRSERTWERHVPVDGRDVAYDELLFWPGITCGFHLPASVAPIGLSAAGLPIGVQIVGPWYGDRVTLSVADMLERTWRDFVPPPGWE
jgi:amidase